MEARLSFAPQSAHIALANRLTWGAVEEQPDGGVVVTFSSPDLDWAASLTLAFGPLVEVVDPPALRELVHAWAGAVKMLYEQENK